MRMLLITDPKPSVIAFPQVIPISALRLITHVWFRVGQHKSIENIAWGDSIWPDFYR